MLPRSLRKGLLSSPLQIAGVAQSAEHLHGKEGVRGSIPLSGSTSRRTARRSSGLDLLAISDAAAVGVVNPGCCLGTALITGGWTYAACGGFGAPPA
jgi:hypothetical protein